jgi:hypothetical protein
MALLTDQEKQDIIRYLEADRPLPDKYRFLLFEEKGQIVKVSKDKDGIVSREVLTKDWTDWVDYWAVDFDFENKREIIRVPINPPQPPFGKGGTERGFEEVWTGDYIFENEWQSFRTKKDRSLEFKSVFRECLPGRHKIAIKVVDIFGNDTIIEVAI